MHRRLIPLIISLIAAILPAAAADSFTVGNLTYTPIDETTCSVKANPDSKPSDHLDIPSTITNSSDNAVYTVTEIGENAFDRCSDLTSVTIPESVTSIKNQAFVYCESLISVTIPDKVKTIGHQAFVECTSLTSVTIGSGVNSIGISAFSNCTALTSITIGDGVTSIGEGAFYNCKALTSVTLPDKVETIGHQAFDNCTALTSVTIGSGVTSIGYNAFVYCENLNKVIFTGNNPPTIETNSFYSIAKDAKYYVPAGSEEAYKDKLGEKAVISTIPLATQYSYLEFTPIAGTHNCSVSKGEGVMPAAIEIPEMVLIGNGADTDLYTVTEIGENAFKDCKDLTSVTIPESVTEIGASAFYNCKSLATITIPESVTEIGASAFYNCKSLVTITIPESVTSIGISVFNRCSDLTSVTIPESVTKIGASAFEFCTSLASITIPEGVTEIGAHAFDNCTSLASITIPEGVTEIAAYAFYNCRLDTITIPESVTSIGISAFSNCAALTSIKIGGGVTSIGEYAFEFSGLKSITIPEGVTSMGNAVFANCSRLISVTIGDGVTEIGADTFLYCTFLTSVTLPKGLLSIGERAFHMCNYLKSITIPEGVTSILDEAFCMCSSLTSVTIPEGVTSIGNNAFNSCDKLNMVTIGKGVTEIGIYAFGGCGELEKVIFRCDNPPTVDSEAFNDIAKDTKYYVPVGTEEDYADRLRADAVILGYVDGDNNSDFVFEVLAETQGCSVKSNESTLSGKIEIPSLALKTVAGVADVYPVTQIGDEAFRDRRYLKSVTIPAGVTAIGANAFADCTALTSISMDNGVTIIGKSAFSGCSQLTAISLPESLTSIEADMFSACRQLTSVAIPENVAAIGDNAFSGCSGLTSVVIPAGVTAIGENAFADCTALTEAVMLRETTVDNIGAIGLSDGATLYVVNPSVAADYNKEDLTDAKFAIKPILTVTSEKEYCKVSEALEIPEVTMPSVYQPETAWSAEGNGAVDVEGSKLTVTDHGDVTFKVSDVNNPLIYATYTVKGYLQGDANYSGEVTVTDAANVALHIVGSEPEDFFELGADANEDKAVNIADVSTIVDIALDADYDGGGGEDAYSRAGGAIAARVRAGAVDVMPGGIDCGELTAIQADVVLAPGTRIRGVAKGDCLSESHSIVWREHAGGRVRVMVYSIAPESLRDGGSIFTIETEGETEVVTVENIFASTCDGEETMPGYSGCVTGISVPEADDEPGTLYDLDGKVAARGVKVSELPSGLARGIYIFRNSKGAVKLLHE